jgi:branched-chain amino acid transport system permease protein
MILILQLIVFGLVQGSKFALLSTSFWLVFSTTRTFHLAHAISYAIAAYATVTLCTFWGYPLWIGAIGSILAAVLFGCGVEALVYRRLRSRNAGILAIFLASLGISTAGTSLLQLIFGAQVYQVDGFPKQTFDFNGVTVTNLDVLATAVSLLLVAGVVILTSRTRFGNSLTAVRTNTLLAMAVGISVNRIALQVFALASAMAAVAAYFETVNFVAHPTMGLQPVLYSIVAVFLGGIASVWGAALGGMALGFLLVFSGLFVSQSAGVILVFAVLAAVIVFKPEGLLRGPRNI